MSDPASLIERQDRLLLAGSGRSLRDHKAAVRHSEGAVRTLHSLSGAIFRTDFISPDQTWQETIKPETREPVFPGLGGLGLIAAMP